MQDFPSLGFQIIFKTKLNLNHSKILVYFSVVYNHSKTKVSCKKYSSFIKAILYNFIRESNLKMIHK